MPQLDITTYSSQIFWLILTLFLLYIFIEKIICPKAEEIIKNRSEFIENNLLKAEDIKTKAIALEKIYNQQMNEIKDQIKDLQNSALDKVNDMLEENKKKLYLIIKEIEAETEENLKKLSSEVNNIEGEISVKLAKLIIHKMIDIPVDEEYLKECYRMVRV